MKIGLIIYDSLDKVTGGYIYDKKLVDYLNSKGVILKIFSQPMGNSFKLLSNNFSKKMLTEIIQFSPDILLQDEMNFLSLFFLNRKLKHIANFPIIAIVHLLQAKKSRNGFLSKIEKLYLKSIAGFIFTSQSTQESVQNIVGRLKNSIVAYPGKDRLEVSIQKNDIIQKCRTKNFKIIFIGNLLYGKGLHLLLQALSKIDHQHWQLTIVGGWRFDQSYAQTIFKMVADLGFQQNVKLVGLLDVENLKRELTVHHLLAVPSYYESFGIVYAESMGAGLPVIATQAGGAQEIIVHQENGFLITPGNIETLKDSICTLIENRQLLLKMSLASLSKYETLPTWNETMEKIYRFLNHMVSAH